MAQSSIARSAMLTSATTTPQSEVDGLGSEGKEGRDASLMPPPKTVVQRALGNDLHSDSHKFSQPPKGGVGTALTDTPVSTAPPSPQM